MGRREHGEPGQVTSTREREKENQRGMEEKWQQLPLWERDRKEMTQTESRGKIHLPWWWTVRGGEVDRACLLKGQDRPLQ